ncbi:hypothetical protein BRADI_3g56115v3 [Brachypodium distachyon]|uniref:Uncharacterized protein n=1 Tax=Brachypodium distachyon TaxID=15368 RepID=I1IE81_BRADI|nr:hypothetical protein BRADI_3g56115v3 [Brachypodium distachyon]
MRRFFQHLLPCILLLLLVMSRLPSSSHGLRTLREETGSELRGHVLPPAISPSRPSPEAGGDANSTAAKKYDVSKRAVPRGPNPLHN